jgi:predicted amidophosphoribosyltransferase
MEFIPDHDRYLDPPEYPTHGFCAGCQDKFDYDDMTEVGDKWYCNDCLDDLPEEE